MTTKWKNVSPYGDLDIPLLGRVVAAGEVVDLTPEQAKALGGPHENFEHVIPKKKSPPKKATPKAAAPENENPTPPKAAE